MDIFVISLKSESERRASVATQLASFGLDFSFFDAVQGARAWRNFLGYDRHAYRLNAGREAVTAEAGCYASHLTLWHRAVAFDRPLVVLEDDFQASQHLAHGLAAIAGSIDRFGFVRLDPCPPDYVVQRENLQGYTVGYCQRYPHGAMGYAISPRTARAFIATSAILRAPVDKFIKLFWEHGQPLYVVMPHLIARHPLSEHSAIESTRSQARLSNWNRLRRPLQKVRWAFQRARFNSLMFNRPHRSSTSVLPENRILPIPAPSLIRKYGKHL